MLEPDISRLGQIISRLIPSISQLL